MTDDVLLARYEAALVPGERCPLCRERVSGCRACSDSCKDGAGFPCSHCDVGVPHGSDFVRRRGRSFARKYQLLEEQLRHADARTAAAELRANGYARIAEELRVELETPWWRRLLRRVRGA